MALAVSIGALVFYARAITTRSRSTFYSISACCAAGLLVVQLSLNIDTHDLETKTNHAIRFLKAGNKVKVSIRFRGREMVHPERGYEIMEAFAASCAEYGTVEKPAKLENRNMLMFLAAKPTK